jgi:uncharacterized membrane protein
VRKKRTWWSRPLKPFWMLGSLIGFGISALIESKLLHWTVIALSICGLLFAVVFRLMQRDDEI